MARKLTPDFIRSLKPNQVFVFGSNTEGRHGKGAAKDAVRWGAIYGQARGIQGNTYAICTKDLNGGLRSYPLSKIEEEIVTLLKFAKNNPDKEFLVTKVGVGLAGYDIYEIGDLFRNKEIPDNVWLPKEFWDRIAPIARKRVGQNLIEERLFRYFNLGNLCCIDTGLKTIDDDITKLEPGAREILADYISEEWHRCIRDTYAVDVLQVLWDIGEIPTISKYYQDNAIEALLYNPKMRWENYYKLIDWGTEDVCTMFIQWTGEMMPVSRDPNLCKIKTLRELIPYVVDTYSEDQFPFWEGGYTDQDRDRFEGTVKPLLLGLGLVEPPAREPKPIAIASPVVVETKKETEVSKPWEPFENMPDGVLGYSTLPFLQ